MDRCPDESQGLRASGRRGGIHPRARALRATRSVADACSRDVGLWAFYVVAGDCSRSRALARQLLEIGESSGDAVLAIGGHHSSAGSSAIAGRLEEATHHARRVMELYRPEYDPLIIAFFADHSASASRGWHAASLTAMGRIDQARVVERAQREFIEGLGHGQTHAQGFIFLYLAAVLRRDYAGAAECAREMRRMGERYELPVYVAFGNGMLDTVMATPAEINRVDASRAVICDMFGFRVLTTSMHLLRKAELQLEGNDASGASATTEAALEWIRAHDESFLLADALRTRAECQRLLGEVEQAETSFRTAIDVARGQGARLFELRATTGLARLLKSRGRRDEASDALQPLVASFSEGLDAVDLREASALIAELRASAESRDLHVFESTQ